MNADRLGGDILAERRLTQRELGAALSSLLSVFPEKIIVFEDWQDLPGEHDHNKIYCRCWHPQGGEFHTVIDLPDSLLHSLPRNSTASRLAILLGCRLLVDDGSLNPYTFLLYDGQGGFQPAAIDVDASDRDEIVIDKEWKQ